MAAARLQATDMPPKISGDQFFATEIERIRAVLNEHADELDAAGFAGIAATNAHPAFATAREAINWLLAQPGFVEFVTGQTVRAGNLYLTSTGVWAPRYDFTAQQPPVAGPNWRLVAGFAGQASSIGAAGITDATDAGRRMLTAADAAAQRALVNNPNIAAGAYGDNPRWVSTDDPTTGLYQWVVRNILTLLAAQPSAQPAPVPTITGFLPPTGAVGATITFSGTLFTKATAVAFNGTPASFQVINAGTIVVTVPPGATNGPVAVSTSSGTATSAASFVVAASAGDGTARDPFNVPAAKRRAVVDADAPAVTETDENYYGCEFVDEVYGPNQPAYYKCAPSAPAQAGGSTVWRWFRFDVL